MKRLQNPEYVIDIKRVQRVLISHGYDASLIEAEEVWQKHSTDWSASWVGLDALDSNIWGHIKRFVEEE